MDSIKSIGKAIISFRESILIIAILLMGLFMSIMSPYFLSWRNMDAIFLGLSVEGIITIGMVIVLISGGLDLSVGSTLALAGVVTGLSLNAGIPVVFSISIGLFSAMMVGFVNGILIAKVGLNPFITTLGMLMAVRGLVLVVAKGRAVLNLPMGFKIIGQGKLWGMQYPIFLLFILVLVGDYILRNSRFMRQGYYVGGNEKAAKLNGINVAMVKIINYITVSFLAGLSGILITARFGSASVTIGQGLELRVITAVIIGGASLRGGEGSVFGAFLGALFMGIISNSLNLLGVNIYWQNLVMGVTLILAVLFDVLSKRRKTGNLV